MKIATQTILVNCAGSKMEMTYGRKSMELCTIRDTLGVHEYREVDLFPCIEPVRFVPAIVQQEHVLAQFKSLVDPSKKLIIGMSATEEDLPKLGRMAILFRSNLPKASIIGMGHLFEAHYPAFSSGKLYLSPVELVLKKKLCDAVVVGECTPFIDLVTGYDGDIASVKTPGMFYLGRDGRIKGTGAEKEPFCWISDDLLTEKVQK